MRTTSFAVIFLALSGTASAENGYNDPAQTLGDRLHQEQRFGQQPTPQQPEPPKLPAETTKPQVTKITGACSIKDEHKTLGPCPSVGLRVLDAKGKRVGRANVENSKFEFLAPPGLKFFVSVDSKVYRTEKAKLGPYQAGDFVDLELLKK